MTDAITVTAEAEVLQTDRADVRAEIPSQQLSNLPVPVGRNYQNLFIMIPGVSPPQNMHSVAVNPSRGLVFSSGGTTQNANAIRIEGAISNNLWLPHVAAYIPALEAIDTVSVVTNSFDADEGLSGGMSANVRIKSGTNQLHGSAFGYHYNEGMKARPYFLPSGNEKPKTRQNQWGGTLGGPIKQNNAFFFGSYETHRRRADGDALRHGADRGDAARRFLGARRRRSTIRSRARPMAADARRSRATSFRASRLDPTVQKLLAGLPMPTNGNLTDNYFASAPFTFTRHKVDAKVNVNPSSKLTFSGRLGWINHKFDSPPMFGDLGGLPVSEASGKQGIGTGNTVSITGSALVSRDADVHHRHVHRRHDHQDQLAAVSHWRESRHRFPRAAGHERRRRAVQRLAAVRGHRLFADRRRGQQRHAVHRRQLAVSVDDQRDLDARPPHASSSAATSCVRR